MKYTLFCRDDDNSKQTGQMISQKLDEAGWQMDEAQPELVICIGGDGTILRAIHEYIDQLDSAAFVGLHTGTLGFFTDYTKNQLDEFLHDLLEGEFVSESFSMIEAVVDDGEKSFYAFNEFRIGNFTSSVRFDVWIDHELFESTCGCGLCICTQAGATGANRALEGAVVDPGLEVLQLTEIMPITHHEHHSLGSPYIMKGDRIVTITGKDLSSSTIAHDHLEDKLENTGKLTIRLSDKRVHFARFRPYSYLKRLRNLY